MASDKSSSDPATRLKALVQERVRLVSADCDTFLHVRCDGSLLPQWGSGGGNFMMALGSLSALNFLAKLHRHLDSPESFVTQVDRERVEEARKDLTRAADTLKSERERLTQEFPYVAGLADMLEQVAKTMRDRKTQWKPPFPGSVDNE